MAEGTLFYRIVITIDHGRRRRTTRYATLHSALHRVERMLSESKNSYLANAIVLEAFVDTDREHTITLLSGRELFAIVQAAKRI